MPDRLLGEKASEQCLDGVGAPGALGRDPLGHVLRGERAFFPQHLHHGMFGITDTIGHRHSPSTTSVIASITSVVNARFQTERRPTPGANPRDHKIGVGLVYTWACRDRKSTRLNSSH